MPKRYNTPHRSRVVKTRLSEDEYADFTARLAPYGISQSEFLRQAIRRTAIRPVIHVSAVNDELLSAVGKLTAEYGKILAAAVQRGQPVVLAGDKPASFIKDGLHGKLVMLKKQVLFGGSVVGVLRA